MCAPLPDDASFHLSLCLILLSKHPSAIVYFKRKYWCQPLKNCTAFPLRREPFFVLPILVDLKLHQCQILLIYYSSSLHTWCKSGSNKPEQLMVRWTTRHKKIDCFGSTFLPAASCTPARLPLCVLGVTERLVWKWLTCQLWSMFPRWVSSAQQSAKWS